MTENGRVRAGAAESLGLLGPEARMALPRLINCLEETDDLVLLAVLTAVAKIGPGREAVPALSGILSRKELSAQVNEWAVSLLAIMGPDAGSSVPILVETLRDPDHRLHGPCSIALGRIRATATLTVPALIEALGDEEKWCKTQAMEALGRFGALAKEAVPALIKVLASNYHDQLISPAAAGALVSIGPDAVPTLAEALKSGDGKRRRSAALALGEFGPLGKAALPELVAALKDEDPNVVLAAIRSVGAMGADAGPAATALLGLFRREDEFGEYRRLAAEALGRIGPGAAVAVPRLLEALGDESSALRAEAALALGRIGAGAQKAVPLLRGLLEDESLLVRCLAALSLLDYGVEHARALKTLNDAFQDPQFHERCQVLAKLEGHPSEARWILDYLIAALKEDDTTLLLVLPLLAAIGPEARTAVPAIREVMMNHESRAEPAPHPFAGLRKRDVEEAARDALRRMGVSAGKESP